MCLQFMVTARPFRNHPQGASRVLRFTEDGVASEPKKETFNNLKRSLEQRSGGGGVKGKNGDQAAATRTPPENVYIR
jgi:hypothetical protein